MRMTACRSGWKLSIISRGSRGTPEASCVKSSPIELRPSGTLSCGRPRGFGPPWRSNLEALIVGAGPYGLSIATHLRSRKVPFRIFGQPMRFWQEMPSVVFLKSLGFATTIDGPENSAFSNWCRERGLEDREPCSVRSFYEYGLWLQKKLVPEVERVDVQLIERAGDGFVVTLASGERVEARRVVVAVGLQYFQRMPEVLAGLPRELVSHTA